MPKEDHVKATDLITPAAKQRVRLVSDQDENDVNPALVRERKKQRVEVSGEFFIESLASLLEVSPEDFRWKAADMQRELDKLVLREARQVG